MVVYDVWDNICSREVASVFISYSREQMVSCHVLVKNCHAMKYSQLVNDLVKPVANQFLIGMHPRRCCLEVSSGSTNVLSGGYDRKKRICRK